MARSTRKGNSNKMAKIAIGRMFQGVAGRATEILFACESSDPPDWQASVALWYLTCPRQSPAWSNFLLGIIHLRPIDNVKPAIITRTGATHEILLTALNPACNPTPLNPEKWVSLRPINYVGQLILPSDGAAKSVLEDLALRVIEGRLWAEPPLSGQKEPWESHVRSFEKGRTV